MQTCFTGPNAEQERLVAFAEVLTAQLDGQAFYNYGSTKPSPENNIYPWFRTTDGRWYIYSGGWISPVNYDLLERRWYAGDLTQLQTYDGGDSGAASDRSGPMWTEDTDMRGRSPMHPGAIADANPAKTLAIGENYGSGSHAQTVAELAAHTHEVKIPAGGNEGALPRFNTSANTTSVATVDVISESTGGGAAMPIVHNVRGLYCVKWTGRLYRFIP